MTSLPARAEALALHAGQAWTPNRLGSRAKPRTVVWAGDMPPGAAIRRPERAPDVGTTHTPMRVHAEPRTVTGIMGDEVTYRTATTERTVKVGTFNDWRRDMWAVESRG